MDYYLVLGIAEDADAETVRSAFRALARRFHPDVGAGSSQVEFQRAREAYETLINRERRRQYDRQLRASRAQPVPVRELREVSASRPFVEPLADSRRATLGVPRTWVKVTRPSLLDELVEELFASFDDRWFHTRRRW